MGVMCWPLRVNQHITPMANSPFRSCDYCRCTERSAEREPRYVRRAWTIFDHTRKMACPKCQDVGRAENRKALTVLRKYGSLLEHRVVAEPAPYNESGTLQASVLEQYRRIKERHPGAVLLFRAGDWYYALETDAETCSSAIGMQTGLQWVGEELVRLGNFPAHALELYLPRLVRCGYRVAICDELQGPPVPSVVCEDPGQQLYGNEHGRNGETPCGVDRRQDGQHEWTVDGPEWTCGDGRNGRFDRPSVNGEGTGAVGRQVAASKLAEPQEQYRRIKPLYKDALLILRDHQGYLMLYRDAQRAAEVLQVDHNGTAAFRIAKSMLEMVLDQLVRAGHRVAVVIDPHVDDPRMARQVDLWDELATEATVVGEPQAPYVFPKRNEVRFCLVERPHGTAVEVHVNWLGNVNERLGRVIHLSLYGGRASSETGYRSHFMTMSALNPLTEEAVVEMASGFCDERFAELNPGVDPEQGVLF